MPPSAPSIRRRFMMLGAGCALVAVVVVAWLARPAPSPEVPMSGLVRIDGTFRLASDTKRMFSGWVVESYAGGARKSRSALREGRLHGLSEGWHTNGVIQVREHFAEGTADGPVTRWHPNGVLRSEGLARSGKLEGSFRRWHPDGTLAEEFTLAGGQPAGLARAWHPDGSPKSEVIFSNGVPTSRQFWPAGEGPAALAAKRLPATP